MTLQNTEEQKQISRRDVIKAGGVVALGLAYSKPFVETVSADQGDDAFKDYGGNDDDNNNDDDGGGGNCKGKDENATIPWDCSSIGSLEFTGCNDDGTMSIKVCLSNSTPLTVAVPWTASLEGGTSVNGTVGPMSDCDTANVPTGGKKILEFSVDQHPDHPGKSSEKGLKLKNLSCSSES